jgi:hypothetical protein
VTIISQRAAHGETITAHGLALFVVLFFQRPLNGPHPAHQLLEFGLGVPIRLENRASGFIQIVKMAKLMRHTGQTPLHRLPDRLLAIGNNPANRDRHRCLDLIEQSSQISSRAAEKRSC